TACPAFVVYLGWNTVGWRRGSKDVGNEAFIIAPYGVVSDPARRRAPVPIQHMLTVLSVPIPFDGFPAGIGACSQLLFMCTPLLKIFPYANQGLCHESRFNKIATIVVVTKGFGPTGRSV